MSWPLSTDYGEAIQNLAVNFQDPEIRAGQVAANGLGQPLVWTGNFAAVFQVHGAAPQKWAVKCFTRQVKGLQERYRRIDAHLRQQRLPFMVGFRYLPDEVLVRGQRFPALKMDWVEGLALDQFLNDCLRKGNAKGTLRILCDMWVKLAQRLRAADVAHGDLQHGNVLLVPVPGKEAYNLRLIDYDGMYVPALGELPPGEVGHAAYQHPERLATGAYGPEIDRFSHLLIYTTLRCLVAGGRELWDRHYNEDRLLLGPLDLLEPETSRVFEQLWQLEDAAARSLVGHLLLASKSPLATAPLLDAVVPDSEVVPLTGDQLRLVEQWLPRRISQAPQSPKMTASADVVGNEGSPPVDAAAVLEPVEVACRCGRRFRAAPHLWGERVACLGCGAAIDVPNPVDLATDTPALDLLSGLDELATAASVSSSPLAVRTNLLTPSRMAAARKPQFDLVDWLQEQGRILATLAIGILTLAVFFLLWLVFSGSPSSADRAVATAVAVTEMEEDSDPTPEPKPESVPEPVPAPIESSEKARPASPGRSPPLAVAPFDAAAAKQHQERWAAHLGTAVETTNSIGMKLTLIPPGEFGMGSTVSAAEIHRRFPGGQVEWYEGEHPHHPVRITRPYYLGTHEVSVADFERFVTATGHKTTAEKEGNAQGYKDGEWKEVAGLNWRKPGFDQQSTHPVTCVSWDDAAAFCQWLSREDGRTYRLPTEAEWEYACRAGTDTLFFWGDDPDAGTGYLNAADETGTPDGRSWTYKFNFKDGYATTSPVGRFKPNAFGLYDILGNVSEWCSDWYGGYTSTSMDDPTGATAGSYRVGRGGSWGSPAGYCRSAYRSWGTPGHRSRDPFRAVAEGGATRSPVSPKPDSVGLCETRQRIGGAGRRGVWGAAPAKFDNPDVSAADGSGVGVFVSRREQLEMVFRGRRVVVEGLRVVRC